MHGYKIEGVTAHNAVRSKQSLCHLVCSCVLPLLRFRWSGISRRERYRKRCEDAGDTPMEDEDAQLLPGRRGSST